MDGEMKIEISSNDVGGKELSETYTINGKEVRCAAGFQISRRMPANGEISGEVAIKEAITLYAFAPHRMSGADIHTVAQLLGHKDWLPDTNTSVLPSLGKP